MSQADPENPRVTINECYAAEVLHKLNSASLESCAAGGGGHNRSVWSQRQASGCVFAELPLDETDSYIGWKFIGEAKHPSSSKDNGSNSDSWELCFSVFTHIKLWIHHGKIYVLYPFKILNRGSYSTVNAWVQPLQDICSDIKHSSQSVGCGRDESLSLTSLSKCKGSLALDGTNQRLGNQEEVSFKYTVGPQYQTRQLRGWHVSDCRWNTVWGKMQIMSTVW